MTRLTRPHLAIRTRLTVLYGGMLLVAGGVLITIFYTIFSHKFVGGGAVSQLLGSGGAHQSTDVIPLPSGHKLTYADLQSIRDTLDQRRHDVLAALLRQYLIALAAVAIVAVSFGWWMAGRALRPIHDITGAARRVAGRNLHERIALQGPRDELKELADTFDAMLERLDASFDSQRRFVANASHELRTPIATIRTLLEVALTQHRMPRDLGEVIETVLDTNQRNEELIDGLLTLARSENELLQRRHVDLSDIAAGALEETADEAATAGVLVDATPDPAHTSGDPILLERLALNLVRNGIKYNHRGGRVSITTTTNEQFGWTELVVTSTGPVVAQDDVEAIFEPFRRLGDPRVSHDHGAGLGLSIVRSITRTHGGEVTAVPREGGGLTVRVRLPADGVAEATSLPAFVGPASAG
jgi:signal transduction histidine kinase